MSINKNVEKEFFTLKEVAEAIGASYGTVKRDIDHGNLPAYRVGRKYFVGKEDVVNYRTNMHERRNVNGYTIQELMEKIPLSYAFIVELIKSKKLEAVKVGRQYIIPFETFESFMKNKKIEG
ncbi:helix-turn-helix domain-containing protein [Dehalobacterium formicoaceticum]|uniref:Excisionase family DNA-binding protein n=1 Tax=Dehalobacterium formicoaceticum TaxID=51515 RepID=A0ABT1Y5F8_9FIRM|nr:helix-turn-helix domain-containing protein [Dehalobacterium formicoaceticum]MCR6546087.1 excisionase family DNA-binding protein [Dehalobacterium formicoaceticum]